MAIKPEEKGLFKSGDYTLEKDPNGGRPRVALTHEQLKAICRLNPSKADVAAFFECGETTIDDRCKEFEGLSFREFRAKYLAHTRLNLVRRALKMAENNTAMMIFCLKNMNKWVDNVHIENKIKVEQVSQMSDEELAIEARRIIDAKVIDEPKRVDTKKTGKR